MVRLTMIGVALVLASGIPTTAGEATLQVRLSQRVARAPAALSITAFVEKDDAHRALVVEAESAAFYRRSLITLNGAVAARAHTVRYRDLPEGEYLIRVSLHGSQERLAVDETSVTVMGHAGDVSRGE